MPARGLSHINIRAPRPLLDELRDFYVNVVGLVPGPRPPFASRGYWLYAGEWDVLHLSEARVGDHRVLDVRTTLDHFALACSDVEGHVQRLVDAGVQFERDFVPVTQQCQLFFNDPAGNLVELNFA